ncbi:hypothetical protein OSB04_023569 [Centaurea solstitialis]|uniref:CCHC-type domain-containing protein n=1 Tax=Centaurea solstitialis TaxID=347529 RepID=A0AA38VZS4_9ASTR|nr:hypothetical protein OSB04_023569 [Centaurea solstitialis]
MLATMSPELQTGLMNTNAYDMIRQLRDMFQTQVCIERYNATRALNACKMAKGTSVSAHVMKMKRHIDHLERFGHPVPLQLATDMILNSLSEDYKQFVINYNMNNMDKTIAELHSMLKTAELSMGAKSKDVLMVRDGGVKKKCGHENTSNGKGQVQAGQRVPMVIDNGKGKGQGKKVKPNKARTKSQCFKCLEVGHWRQNCPRHHEAATAVAVALAAAVIARPPVTTMVVVFVIVVAGDGNIGAPTGDDNGGCFPGFFSLIGALSRGLEHIGAPPWGIEVVVGTPLGAAMAVPCQPKGISSQCSEENPLILKEDTNPWPRLVLKETELCINLYCKAEYVAAASYCSQALWMQTQLRDYGYSLDKIPILCDSKSATAISANPMQHSKTKHIDITYHFLKYHVEEGNVKMYFVTSEYQLADLFTKALGEKRFNFLVEKIGMLYPES